MDDYLHYILQLFENKEISNKMLIHLIFLENNINQIKLSFINKKIKDKYGKNNIKYFIFPCDNNCKYSDIGHNDCICMSFYCRPKF